jgi:hypothetical protein
MNGSKDGEYNISPETKERLGNIYNKTPHIATGFAPNKITDAYFEKKTI